MMGNHIIVSRSLLDFNCGNVKAIELNQNETFAESFFEFPSNNYEQTVQEK